MDGYTSQDIADMWGVTRQVIDKHLRIAARKIAGKSAEESFELLEKRYHNCLVG